MAARSKKDEIREAAEQSLVSFIKLVAPHRVLGAIHEEVIHWWTRDDAWDHQLLLLPRDHQKSALIAYRVAWEITRNPAITVLYISATANLAEKQLYFIKSIFNSKVYNTYWPEMFNPEEGKRERWTATEISTDHPLRKLEGVRDPTIFTAGLTTTITGLHFNIAVLDDVVVKENAYTEEGRTKVREQYSLLSSIETVGAREWVVGTRYHPKDLYNDIVEMEYDVYTENGEVEGTKPVYEVFQREVEDRGDGTGEFIWPRQQRHDGRWYGFDASILAKKRAKYLDKAQFHSQYYNNPNDPGSAPISHDKFQYYDKRYIESVHGDWHYKEERMNVVAAIDFAFSLRKKADYTTIVVVGCTADHDYFVLDIDRFKTDRISEYFEHIKHMYLKWSFKKLRAEVTVAQQAIVKELKDTYIKREGMLLSIDEHRPTRFMGTKEERINATLQPRYDSGSVWHYRGGNCQLLEEELVMGHPPHDDIKDALANAIEIATAPMRRRNRQERQGKIVYHPRFGGVAV